MSLAMARYVQTGTQRSNATNWAIGLQQAWFNTVRKETNLVTHAVSGTPSVSKFTLNAPGVWAIAVGARFASITSTVQICRTTNGDAGVVAANGDILHPNAVVTLEVDYLHEIFIRWGLASSTTMNQSFGDTNFVSFVFLGAI